MRTKQAIYLAIVFLASIGLKQNIVSAESPPEGDGSQVTNPCDYTKCRGGTSCEVENGRAKCVCNIVCPALYDPVCGSDGKSYSNSCELDVHNCVNNDNVSEAHKGACQDQSPESNPCAFTTCREGSDCTVENGQVKCVCRTMCPFNYDPVCGLDGKTYSNACQLSVANCQNNQSVAQAYKGECKRRETNRCASVRCRSGSSCEVVRGRAKCVCNSVCPQYIDELCGSDGKTYANECQLGVSNCKNNRNVVKAYSGPCRRYDQMNPCDYTRCRAGANCVVENGRAKCVCNTICPNYFAPADVCGSDGRTYSSPCELEKYNCKNQQYVVQVHDGPCNQLKWGTQ